MTELWNPTGCRDFVLRFGHYPHGERTAVKADARDLYEVMALCCVTKVVARQSAAEEEKHR
jgi:hypothetical protein